MLRLDQLGRYNRTKLDKMVAYKMLIHVLQPSLCCYGYTYFHVVIFERVFNVWSLVGFFLHGLNVW
jgi:hypothetical protein